MEGGWGFTAGCLIKLDYDQLNIAAGNGNLDKINLLIEGGADINGSMKMVLSNSICKNCREGRYGSVAMKKGAKDTMFRPRKF